MFIVPVYILNNTGIFISTTGTFKINTHTFSGCWPFVFRCANLPDGLSTNMSNCHLSLLSANEFWVLDEESGSLRRTVRGPKSLNPHLHVIVDDLLGAYTKGVTVVDASIPEGHDGRRFKCRVCLLFWTGDYPGQALVSGTHSKTCHWCTLKSEHASEVSRRTWGNYRTYLPGGHNMRKRSGRYGAEDMRPPPPSRTHDSFVEQGVRNTTFAERLRRPDARRQGIISNYYWYSY